MSAQTTAGTGIPAHVVDRRDFSCALCEQPWPCSPAKADLAERYRDDPVKLGEVMVDFLFEAVTVYLAPPRELYERFIAWTGYPRAGDAGA